MRVTLHLFALLVLNASGYGQMPETDIWLFKLPKGKESTFKAPLNISNKPGYDNQPSFSRDQKSIYYVTVNESNQADIVSYKISNKKSKLITQTSESEYSPREAPIEQAIAVVAVLKDSSQVIQLLAPKVHTVLPSSISSFDSVGYYGFLNADTVLYYKLTEPHSLRFFVISNGNDQFICENPTRTFTSISRTQFIYGVKDSSSTNYFIYNTILQKAELYANISSVNEDIWWHPKLGLLVSDGASILNYNKQLRSWTVLYDLKPYGVNKITRFCFEKNNKYLVIVNNL